MEDNRACDDTPKTQSLMPLPLEIFLHPALFVRGYSQGLVLQTKQIIYGMSSNEVKNEEQKDRPTS